MRAIFRSLREVNLNFRDKSSEKQLLAITGRFTLFCYECDLKRTNKG